MRLEPGAATAACSCPGHSTVRTVSWTRWRSASWPKNRAGRRSRATQPGGVLPRPRRGRPSSISSRRSATSAPARASNLMSESRQQSPKAGRDGEGMATKTPIRPRESDYGVRTMLALLVLLTGQFMANVDIAVVNVAAPTIHTDLHTGNGQLQLVVSGFVLAYAMLLITGARLGAMYGFRRVFLIGAGGFTLASLACGLAMDPISLMIARFAQGAAAGLMVPQVLTGIQTMFSGERRARALGYYTLALSGGAVVGQILGGVLVWADLFGSSWRPIFLINVPIGAALVAAAARTLPRGDRDPGQRLDLRGVVLLSLTVTFAVLPLVLGRESSWPAWTWVCLAASPAGLVWFVEAQRRIARRHGSPLVNLDVLLRPAAATPARPPQPPRPGGGARCAAPRRGVRRHRNRPRPASAHRPHPRGAARPRRIRPGHDVHRADGAHDGQRSHRQRDRSQRPDPHKHPACRRVRRNCLRRRVSCRCDQLAAAGLHRDHYRLR